MATRESHGYRQRRRDLNALKNNEPGPEYLFSPGALHITAQAVDALREARVSWEGLLLLHLRGYWGEGESSRNEAALRGDGPLISVYQLQQTGELIRIVTEGDRSCTTIFMGGTGL